ncbi:hypothetical protein EI219_09485 [Streptococcus suis]|uniref:Uncharacterized protein n=1 Tax=Streptococcus suis TaxID=1307 RepID=A0A3R8LV44_STRSU|nr:hypothetical protein EI219_09485 [Streptococcus suis]
MHSLFSYFWVDRLQDTSESVCSFDGPQGYQNYKNGSGKELDWSKKEFVNKSLFLVVELKQSIPRHQFM